MPRTAAVLIAFLFLSFQHIHGGQVEPIATYLTWVNDPSTTMVVTWISHREQIENLLEIRLKSSQEWSHCTGYQFPFPTDPKYLIHRFAIAGLQPDTEYVFRMGENSKLNQFRTMPKQLDKPLSFVVGGDIYHDDISFTHETNLQAAARSPHFAILGGDLAYTAAKYFFNREKTERWIEWLAYWGRDMITPEGNMIPMLPVLGNHDVNGGYNQKPEKARSFHALFPYPGRQGYQALDFGNYLSVVTLDSGHTNPIEGEQAVWLYLTLHQRQDVPHIFTAYHVPAYPCVRSFNGRRNILIRKHWVPIFQRFHVTAAFEHHDHAYKRTHPLTNDGKDPNGVLYLGDGGWGVETPRNPKKLTTASYLASAIAARHFIYVTVDPEKRKYEAINSDGKVIDSHEQSVVPVGTAGEESTNVKKTFQY